MSLRPTPVPEIPEQTARVARAAFPSGNLYMKMRDEFGTLFQDEPFADLFPSRGRPAEAPWRLALVTVFQFAEGLSDRQAADAVRGRIDWKYALSMELEDSGFDGSVLCEFRARLVAHGAEDRLFETLLSHFRERGLLKARGRQRTDSTHVLGAVSGLNRLELLGETLRHALNRLAEAAPEWLSSTVPAEWFDRYGRRMDNYRLPREKAEREALALTIGADGYRLLRRVFAPDAPEGAAGEEAVGVLRRVWVQQFRIEDDRVLLRGRDDMPPGAQLIRSPYDPEVRYSVKRDMTWTGYKVHLTETCDGGAPRLITQVLTTPATTADSDATAPIQEALSRADRLPSEQLTDEGYTDAALLVQSRERHGVEIVGPVARDGSWQASEEGGLDVTRFAVDWESQRATCPNGKLSKPFVPTKNGRGGTFLLAAFPAAECRACGLRPQCTRSRSRGRTLYLHPRPEHEALRMARERQKTPEFRERYAARSGIEGTLSQGVRSFGLRRSRYVGQAKTHLQNLITATALNFCRVMEWVAGASLAGTRTSGFVRLKACQAIQATPP
jgi:transposase